MATVRRLRIGAPPRTSDYSLDVWSQQLANAINTLSIDYTDLTYSGLTAGQVLRATSATAAAFSALPNKFIVQGTVDASLSAAQFLGALGTGIVKNTTTTGVLSIAVASDFPTLNQSTTGAAATLTNVRTIWGQNFNGSANVSGAFSGATTMAWSGNTTASGTGTHTFQGSFVVGHTAILATDVTPIFEIISGLNQNGFASLAFSNDALGGRFEMGKSRSSTKGTLTAPSSLDQIGNMTFLGNDGTNWQQSAQIIVRAPAAHSVTSTPGEIRFFTTAVGALGSAVEAFRILSTHDISINVAQKLFTSAFDGSGSDYIMSDIAGVISLYAAGTRVLIARVSSVELGGDLKWTADATNDIGIGTSRPRDLNLTRNAAIGGTLGVTGITTLSAPVTLKGYTVATLPTGVQGHVAFCTDLLAPAFFAIVVGGGTVVGTVFYNGTNWVAI